MCGEKAWKSEGLLVVSAGGPTQNAGGRGFGGCTRICSSRNQRETANSASQPTLSGTPVRSSSSRNFNLRGRPEITLHGNRNSKRTENRLGRQASQLSRLHFVKSTPVDAAFTAKRLAVELL